MATNLATYLNETRRLLHDAASNFWTQSELTDYINDGRYRVAADTKCLRALRTITITTAVESYPIASTFTSGVGQGAIDVLNVTVLWGALRVPLLYMPWTEFNAKMRTWVNNVSRPAVWSRYGTSPGTIFLGPIPDLNYQTEFDVSYIPSTLVDANTVEELSYPFTNPVSFYAAYKAKIKEQSYAEANIFLEQYRAKAIEGVNQVFTRYLPNVYA